MQRIDDYLNAVRFFLPRKQKDDILRELSENIRAQVADKEERLGRSLSREEEEELLKQYGHPMLFALRYRPEAAHLIGPAVFPFYWLALKIALLVIGFGYAANAVVQLSRGTPVHWLGFFETALPVFGWLTFMFAALDFFILRYGLLEKLNARWNPRSLRTPVKQESRPETIFNWAGRAICTVWWLAGLRNPVWIFGPGALFFDLGPGVHQLYPAIFVLSVAGLLVSWRARRMVRVAMDGVGLIPFCLLPWSGDFVVALQADLRPMAGVINLSIWVSACVSLLIVVLVLAWNGRKYFRQRNAGALAV
jgi:hypothetical protein